MRASDRYAPEFTLDVDGTPVPAALRASVTSLTWQTGLGAADRVELALANHGLRWLDERAIGLDRELRLELGYAPDPLQQVFVGEIVSHAATFPSAGAPMLTVAAQDRMQRLQGPAKARWFAIPVPKYGNMPLPDIAVSGIVALENGLIPIFEPVGAALSVILAGADAAAALDGPGGLQKLIRKQEGESDYDFLTRLSLENGWELKVDHSGPLGGHQLRFFAPLGHQTPDATLSYGRSLLDFTPRLSKVGQIASVTAHIWISQTKTKVSVTVGWDWDRAQLTIEISPQFSGTRGGASSVTVDEPMTPSTAPRAILSKLIPRLNQRLTATASTVGDPRLGAGAVVQIEGVGVEFGGLYRITSATHTVDGGGYRTRFEARKEIWFGSIPLPEQGAIPIRVAA
jgi:phage protein D